MTREQAIEAINRIQDIIGIGYHPDTSASDYLNADGTPVFTDAEADRNDELLDEAFDVLQDDIYAIGRERQQTMLNNAEI